MRGARLLLDQGGAPKTMRGLVTNLLVLLVLAGLVSYVVLPDLVEDQLA
jgi:hypothetical protein